MNDLINHDILNKFDNQKVRIVFDAIPENFISFSKGKRPIKNIFYAVLGLHYEHTNEYVVAFYIYKKKKTAARVSFEIKEQDVIFLKNKLQVMEFIYKFLDRFSPHKRIVNVNLQDSNPTDLHSALERIGIWMTKIAEFFSSIASPIKI
jgi:hypothetical protein